MEFYKRIIEALAAYFNFGNWQRLFLEGGCYWLASVLHQGIPDSYFMINRMEEHCALHFEEGLYDIRGRIPEKNFRIATERDISFMKKNYIPHFDTSDLESYLQKRNLIYIG